MSSENDTDKSLKFDLPFINQWSAPTMLCVRGRYVIVKAETGYAVRIDVPVKTAASEKEIREFVKQIQLKNL